MPGSAIHLTLLIPGLLQPPFGMPPELLLEGPRPGAVEQFLARADEEPAAGADMDNVLLELFGVQQEPGADVPVGAITRHADGGAPAEGWYLRADPVHLRADVSKLILFDASQFSLTQEEAGALAAVVSGTFAEAGWRLEILHPQRWYLRLPAAPKVRTHPLSVVAGRDLHGYLPFGESQRLFHRLLNELQMLLGASPLNQSREQRGLPAVNSLWLWGGGVLPPVPDRRWDRVWGDSPLLQGLAMLSQTPSQGTPTHASAWLESAAPGRHLVVIERLLPYVQYADPEGWRESLVSVDRAWIGPLLGALGRARVASVTLLPGAGPGYRLGRRGMRRWWRRARPLPHYLVP